MKKISMSFAKDPYQAIKNKKANYSKKELEYYKSKDYDKIAIRNGLTIGIGLPAMLIASDEIDIYRKAKSLKKENFPEDVTKKAIQKLKSSRLGKYAMSLVFGIVVGTILYKEAKERKELFNA